MADPERFFTLLPSVDIAQEEPRFADIFVNQAITYEGRPTRWYTDPEHGMDPEEGFDCSGLVTRVLQDVGFPSEVRHANEYFNEWGVPVHNEVRAKGDLVFFSSGGRWPSHVGIMVDDINFIHARPKYGHVLIEPLRLIDIPHNPNQLYVRNPIGFRRAADYKGRYRIIK